MDDDEEPLREPPSASPILRGAGNVIRAYLQPQPGETIVVVHAGALGFVEALLDAASHHDAAVAVLDVEPFAADPAALAARFGELVSAACPTLWVAEAGKVPGSVALQVAELAQRSGCRHLHVPYADTRLLAQSLRADPSVLASVNQRFEAIGARTDCSRVSTSTSVMPIPGRRHGIRPVSSSACTVAARRSRRARRSSSTRAGSPRPSCCPLLRSGSGPRSGSPAVQCGHGGVRRALHGGANELDIPETL